MLKVIKTKLSHFICDSNEKLTKINDRRTKQPEDPYIYTLSTLKEIDTGLEYIFVENGGDNYIYEDVTGVRTLRHGLWVQVSSISLYHEVKYLAYEDELYNLTNNNRKVNKTPYFKNGDKLFTLDTHIIYVYNDETDEWVISLETAGGGSSTADNISYSNEIIVASNVKEALDKIISKVYYIKPSITSFTCVPNAGVYEIGTGKIPSIRFTWDYNKDITTQSLSDCTLADNTIREYTYNTELNSTKLFTLTAGDGENSVTATKTFTFVYPTYYGVLDNNTITAGNITSKCTKLVRAKTEYKGLYTTNKQSVVFASPWTVKSIINQNNYEVISSFNLNRITINGYSYYVYTLPDVTITNFAYTFKY